MGQPYLDLGFPICKTSKFLKLPTRLVEVYVWPICHWFVTKNVNGVGSNTEHTVSLELFLVNVVKTD